MDQPDDAEFDLILKSWDIDLNNDNIIFIDESKVQIDWNVRSFYLLGENNIREVSSKRIRLNSIGALAPKGNSYLSFPERTNAFTLTKFILELLIENCTNKKDKKELYSIINNDNTNKEFLETEMKVEIASKEEDFFKKIKNIYKLNFPYEETMGKLSRLLNKFSISDKKILYRLRTNQYNNIISSKLENKFNDIVIVWDNAKVHIAKHIEELLWFLGVRILPLPVRSPQYNCIEFSWNHTKQNTAKECIDDENHLKNFFKESFYDCIEKNDYCSYWFDLIENGRIFYKSEIENLSLYG